MPSLGLDESILRGGPALDTPHSARHFDIRYTKPPAMKSAIEYKPEIDLSCDMIPESASDARRECMVVEMIAREEIEQQQHEASLQAARDRARRDGKIYLCGRVRRVPSLLLIMRDVFIFSLLGLGLGIGIDYIFSLIPNVDSVGAFFAVYVAQLNFNALTIYGVLQIYERIWYRSPDRYLGYSSFITVLYLSQLRFTIIGARFVMSIHPSGENIQP